MGGASGTSIGREREGVVLHGTPSSPRRFHRGGPRPRPPRWVRLPGVSDPRWRSACPLARRPRWRGPLAVAYRAASMRLPRAVSGFPTVNRARSATLAFATLTALVTVATALVAYRGQRSAFEREFARRLEQLAELAASQVSAADLADARLLGPDGNGLLALQLDAFAVATGLANAGVVDDSGRVVYEVRSGFTQAGAPSPYDSLAHAALVRARFGPSVPFPPFRRGGIEVRAAATRVPADPASVLVTEDLPRWGPELARLRRDLSLLAAVSVL